MMNEVNRVKTEERQRPASPRAFAATTSMIAGFDFAFFLLVSLPPAAGGFTQSAFREGPRTAALPHPPLLFRRFSTAFPQNSLRRSITGDAEGQRFVALREKRSG